MLPFLPLPRADGCRIPRRHSRIRRSLLLLPVQALLMGGAVLATLGRIAGPGAAIRALATWPALLLLLALLPLLNFAALRYFAVYAAQFATALRRKYASPQSRLLLRNSLLGLLGLPLVVAYLLAAALDLLAPPPCWGCWPGAHAPNAEYQRWLIE
ncbi:MAG: hypothetical protein WKG07_35680 [Hymenobacter sp.]